MIDTIKNIIGLGPKVDYKDFVAKGAIIMDVRTKEEFAGGHIKGSINIPLHELNSHLNQFKDKEKTIITCCASGGRSGSAKGLLESKGYKHVYNGGGWYSLQSKIQ
ncbi:MAG: rhodanese-like domain-containing protein [Bacteroidota bacterium]|nr:rhodanese-like domain-containing protein [Bacteroidota bacterium]